MNDMKLTLELMKGIYGVCRLEKDGAIPDWATESDFFSITRTEDELSVVCCMEVIPRDLRCESDWRILKVAGPLDFSLVGILSSISRVLAENGVSIFAVSTYETDYILIKEKEIDAGIVALVGTEQFTVQR